MHKADIVTILEQIAVLLELKGDNPFKIRAYISGARVLETMEEELDHLIENGQLGAVKGIGTALVDKIETLHATGELEYYTKLRASVAPGLIEMLEIPGLGGKKVKRLHDALGIDTIPDLQAACQEGRVESLKGFGKKSAAKILTGISNRASYAKRHLWWEAAKIAKPILENLRNLPEVERVEVAGSLRRLRETVGDIDFIVASSDAAPVMDWFTSQPSVCEVSAHGNTKSSVRFESGLQADIRVVPSEQFTFALHHFTGSKEHNVALRQRALSRGYSLSEWGLQPKEGGVVPNISSEAELFEFLGLAEILPELREGMGELEAGEARILPQLVAVQDIRGVFHNHTTASDGRASISEMACAAHHLGLEYIGLADHSKASYQANGLDDARALKLIDSVHKFNQSGESPVHVFAGIECDILPNGALDLEDSTLDALDYTVVSVHSSFTQSETEMTARVIRAIEHPATTMLGHPTGRLLLRRGEYQIDLHKIIDAAIANHVIIEINANPNRLDLDWRYWRRAAERGLICAINPDAHSTEGLEYFSAGVNIARKGWLNTSQVLNCRSAKAVQQWFLERR